MFLPWLRKPTSLWNTARRASRPYQAPGRLSYRPRLEALEDRWLPRTLTVLNTNDSGPGSLRAEIAASQSGDTIVFDPSLQGQTINLTSSELTINVSLDVEGPAKGGVNVNAVGGRAFNITNPASNVTLANLGIFGTGFSGGSLQPVTQGGAVYDAGATVNLVHDFIEGMVQGVAGAPGNPGGDALGGAIYQAGGTLTLTQCRLYGTITGGTGGAGAAGGNAQGGDIYEAAGTLALDHCTFGDGVQGGYGGTGGALGNGMGGYVYNAGGVLSLTKCDDPSPFGRRSDVFGGIAAGGAIYDAAGTTTTITNCVFALSELTGHTALGGSIYQAGGSLTVTGTQVLFDEMEVTPNGLEAGGAVYVAGGNVSLVNTTIESERVFVPGGSALGGGLYQAGGTVSLTNCTFADDRAFGNGTVLAEGGALYIAGGTTTVQNCAFDGDVAGDGPSNTGYGGAIYIAGGSVCISKNTTFAGDFASTSDPDVFGPFTLC
jgi:hypothetical protein